jgi:hypothetical protein
LDEAALIAEFIAADKVADGRIQWALTPHTDTANAQFLVVVPEKPTFAARVYLTAHAYREPFKYGFSLILAKYYRVLGLDVNPGRSHANFTDLGNFIVRDTHWQTWPNQVVEPDEREQRHQEWFRDFCKQAKIKFTGSYSPPPHFGGQQLGLPL